MATIKQKKAVENIVENGGNVSKGMIDANYSPNTAHTPQKLTESKAWDDLMEEYLPDKDLAQVHQELLNKREKSIIEHKGDNGSEIYEVLDQPETQAASKALDMAYKLKGRMKDSIFDTPPEIHIHNTKINIIITEAREKIKEQLGGDAE